MPFVFEDLDAATRGAMLAELDGDLLGGGVFLSPRLTEDGAARYPALLREALASGSPATFEAALSAPGILKRTELRRTRGGRMTQAKVPHNAAQLIAEGEFNRYYIRGLCVRAIGQGADRVQVYRARPSWSPRPESQLRIGTLLDAHDLLDDLRRHVDGSEPTFLPEVSSGLSVRIPG